ncbi:hemerythrin domain-containing protein [Actinoplanes sp. NPDC051343]|uniref:hemerythrin domain-containing protein n=1 Tax=Actinoplanes sp. NPDC051343 TaxID=3363906 RepID=UPI0037A88C93
MPIDPAAPRDKPETQQMKVIHKAFRREFRLLPVLVGGVTIGDTARARLVAERARLMLALLHEHHDSEDTFIWPLLEQRAPMHKNLVDTMETQHQIVASLIPEVERGLDEWAPTAPGTARVQVARQLADLNRTLQEHLDLEEREVLPLIHDHLSVAEWEAPQKAAAMGLPSGFRVRMLIAGSVLEDATPAEHAWFRTELPPPARILWTLVGRRMYAANVRAVRADAISAFALSEH